jgi:hypothetical protein
MITAMFQKLIPTLMLSLALLVTVSSCKKDDDDKPATPAVAKGMNAIIDGVAFSTTNTTFEDSANVVTITGVFGTTQGVSLVFNKTIGSYSVADILSGASGTYVTDQGVWLGSGIVGGTGTINVTSVSSTGAIGTFNFVAKGFFGTTGEKVVTNGTFNVTK